MLNGNFWKKRISFFLKVWVASFFIIVWTIWKERNLRIFGDSSSTIKDLQDMVLLRIGWWISGWEDGFRHSPSDVQRNPRCLDWSGGPSESGTIIPKPSYIPWSPPSMNILKWNVDASVALSDSCTTIDGVLRNHCGNFMCLFSSPIPFIEINCAEILAIHRAILISLHSNIITQKECVSSLNLTRKMQCCGAIVKVVDHGT